MQMSVQTSWLELAWIDTAWRHRLNDIKSGRFDLVEGTHQVFSTTILDALLNIFLKECRMIGLFVWFARRLAPKWRTEDKGHCPGYGS
ncbi:hypothetical protein CEXT_383131 [Caerostris extrusa]|uniref:Uncharacterized protein n=1 Tax=Caerostris extrusa TaxID=172846 RepID=A0AAV4NYN6_CAEEX|nr:hypothetical protein CEXT_383131 [Caerostris extrusa]